jgi:uncharacterized protein (DUF1800 family)
VTPTQSNPSGQEDLALHAARRLTFGPTPSLLDHIRAVGVDGFIEEQLNPESLDDAETEAMLANFQTLNLSTAEIYRQYRRQAGTVIGELVMATILRAIYSQRQLYELMVDFWSNHFNIFIGDGASRYLKTADDRDVIRAHAMGRFADLLLASAQSPAMLYYLDNYLSQGDNPNENYARELLELHTLGVDGGYQEADIRPTALCLSGWTFGRRTGRFEFRPQAHYPGPLRIMDWETAGRRGADAVQDGVDFLDYLAHHPGTALFLARKLCVRFVSDDPPSELVESAAQVYLENDTAIVPVLRHIFQSDAFWSSSGQKFRRPFELMAAWFRVLDARIEPSSMKGVGKFMRYQLEQLGQPLFGWHAPNGYPDVAPAWLSTGGLLARWNMVQLLTSRHIPRSVVDLAALVPESVETAGDLVDALAQRLLFQPVTAAERAALLDYLELSAADPVHHRMLAYKFPQLVALLLNSTYFQFR